LQTFVERKELRDIYWISGTVGWARAIKAGRPVGS